MSRKKQRTKTKVSRNPAFAQFLTDARKVEPKKKNKFLTKEEQIEVLKERIRNELLTNDEISQIKEKINKLL